MIVILFGSTACGEKERKKRKREAFFQSTNKKNKANYHKPFIMGVSPSGTLTLLFLVFIGPLIYAGNWAYKKFTGRSSEDDSHGAEKEEGEREELSSKQYLFALVGYAIGTFLSFAVLLASFRTCSASNNASL